MLAILSPARNTKQVECADLALTRPAFMEQTMRLVKELRLYEPWQLESLLDVPPERAYQLYDAYRAFSPNAPGSPALLAYYGQAYRNMRPDEFDAGEIQHAQGALRIFSALYGLLRPLDGIQVHRLGLKKQFSPHGQSLHEYWGDILYHELFKAGEPVINIASQEYAKLVTPYMRPGDEMITCSFLVDKPGGPRGTVSTVRAARGLMARFMVVNKVTQPEHLKEFDLEGYAFIPGRSSGQEYVFVKQCRWA